MNVVRHLIVTGSIGLMVLSAVACSSAGSGGSASSSASSATPGFATSCKVTGLSGTELEYDVSVTATTAADVTDVDVEFLKDGVALSTQEQLGSDGGIGFLMSAVTGEFPVFLGVGRSWSYTPASDDYPGPPLVDPSGDTQAFAVMPDTCKVIAVATTANPGNW